MRTTWLLLLLLAAVVIICKARKCKHPCVPTGQCDGKVMKAKCKGQKNYVCCKPYKCSNQGACSLSNGNCVPKGTCTGQVLSGDGYCGAKTTMKKAKCECCAPAPDPVVRRF